MKYTKKEGKILLGKTVDEKAVYTSPENNNGHKASTGGSGWGKSTMNINLMIRAADAGEKTVVLNWHNCLNKRCIMPELAHEYEKYVKKVNVAKDGIGLPLFDRLTTNSGSLEEPTTMFQRLSAMFRVAVNLTGPQERMLNSAIKDVYDKKLYQKEGVKVISEWLTTQKKTQALNAASKIAPLCDGNIFRQGNFMNDSHRIVELDFNDLEYDVQDAAVRFVLDYLLRIANKGAFLESGINLFLDEAQNLEYKPGTTMYTLLNESRRLNLRLMLAFPSLFTGAKPGMDIITQCGTVFFFKPLERDVRKVAEIIEKGRNVDSWVFSLSRLQRGECIATGIFEVDGKIRTTPVLIKNQI